MIKAILTDIEGTTSSISFVKDVLFPYARKRLPAFVETHTDDPEVQHWLHEAAKEAGLVSATREEVIDLLIGWIDADRKSTALKALQGMIWAAGYADGEYRAHVYPEVPARLRAWRDAGTRLYVYSSGSVAAQKLLFGHTDAGDLIRLLRPRRERPRGRRAPEQLDECTPFHSITSSARASRVGGISRPSALAA